ncbi:hypothetical protein ACFWNT_13635 [Streptomyces sp. NPDC058409]
MISTLNPAALGEQIGRAIGADRRKTVAPPSDGLARLADRTAQLAH